MSDQYLKKVRFCFEEQKNFHYPFTGVYMIECFYIGQTKDLFKRIKQHIYLAINDKHCNKELGNYLKNCYQNNHTIDVFLLSSNIYDEQKFIELHEPEFNIMPGISV